MTARISTPTLRRDRGAVAVLFMVIASAGLFAGLTLLAVDSARLFFAHEDAVRAARSIAQAVGNNCLHNDATCTSATALQSFAQSAARDDGAVAVEAVCINLGSDSATAVHACIPSGDLSALLAKCKALPFADSGSTSYARVVLRRTETFQPLFPYLFQPKIVEACGQVTWSGGFYQVPKVIMIPACSVPPVGVDHLIAENPNNSAAPNTGGCGTIDVGNGITLTSDATWLTEISAVVGEDACTGIDARDLSGPSEVIGRRIVKNGYCSPAEIQAYFSPPTGSNPRMFGLGGSMDASQQVTLEAFARFTLVAIFDGLQGRWERPNGDRYTGDTSTFDPSGNCTGKSGKLCMWGHFDAAVAAGHGSTIARKVQVLG